MSKMIMMVGNIGSGKSTLVSEIMNSYGPNLINAVSMDSIITMLSGGCFLYKPFNKMIYRTIEETVIRESLISNIDIIIDRTNMTRKIRARFISIGKEYGAVIICNDFGEGSLEFLGRRLFDRREMSEDTWKRVFNKFKDEYECPELDEGFDEIKRVK